MENNNTHKMDYVTRINLKTATNQREELIYFCLNRENQCLAIGWSCVDFESDDFSVFYNTVVEYVHGQKRRLNPALNIFNEARVNDLFWTRDLDGVYWICRVTEPAKAYSNKDLDIGAVLPIEAYKFGLEVPGQIKASFNRPNGGITEKIKNINIIEYSKFMFNTLSGKNYYDINLNIANNVRSEERR